MAPGYGIQRGEPLNAVRVRVWIVHMACIGIFFVPLTPALLAWAVAGYAVRVFAWEGGSHRYFSHRSFKTGRAFQFLLALLAAAAGQRGPIWWAVHHRNHHRYSDTERDLHSPLTRSFAYAHIGWLLDQQTLDTDLDQARDLARFPELVWINRWHFVFPLLVLAACLALGQYSAAFGRPGLGASAAVWLFFVPTALSLHASFAVNSLTHGGRVGLWHRRPYPTEDATTNVWWLAIPTLGAAWHNNHHRYMNAARAGFRWFELDLTYAVLKLLAALRIVWDLQPVPDAVLNEGRAARR
jgi:stearoyl-CoA desaturase (Delta-9 desaturase)